MKTAFITGITGQDGCYLSKFLLQKGYRVVGLLDPGRNSSLSGLEYLGIQNKVDLKYCDLHSLDNVKEMLVENNADEMYHLASQSSVSESFRSPVETMHVNTIPVINILESVRTVAKEVRVYHASSSEMYGSVNKLPIDEGTLFQPASPYAVSKVAAHETISCYRNSYDLFAVSGILFNHESILRRDNFFTKKLVRESLEIVSGKREIIIFGNLQVKRDFGYAPKYVDAMWRMLQQEQPYDFLICSGQSVSLLDLVNHIFRKLDISPERLKIDQSLFRPNDIDDIYGANSLARERLGWDYNLTAYDTIDLILEETITASKNTCR